ncbi:MAG TPA: M20 family metallopeptidase [Candidatus Halomonas stercoripullorum]|uniref:M20 family metallopeptidase n=1 Tax=Candidatus Halomonas stercoripullorum TaxID=2838617 RepID=A0A9D1WNX3_9GAMM|nr:M20 family metallopeptidase [Candidatus Halomonas stercoripullorum]
MHILDQPRTPDEKGTDGTQEQLALDPVAFLQALIRCNTVNREGNEQALADILSGALLTCSNIELHEYPIEEGRCNLIARVRSERPGPRIVLSGHLDTVPIGNVPWSHDPFAAHIIDGQLYGRGAVDMKSGLAALLCAYLRIAEREPDSWCGELILAATSSEETGAEGAKVMVESGQLPAFDTMIIAEPTDNQLVISHKGVMWIKIISHGKASHGSMPAAGINAIDRMQLLHARLSKRLRWDLTHPLLGSASAEVTMMRAGVQPNMIPDKCEMTFDIRSLPGQEHASILEIVREEIQALGDSDSSCRFDLQVLLDLPALSPAFGSPPASPAVEVALNVLEKTYGHPMHAQGAQYFTDGSIFQRIGGDILVLGPGSPSLAHQVDEHVHVDDYLKAIEIYHQILLALMASK